jgi:hypothetical protein
MCASHASYQKLLAGAVSTWPVVELSPVRERRPKSPAVFRSIDVRACSLRSVLCAVDSGWHSLPDCPRYSGGPLSGGGERALYFLRAWHAVCSAARVSTGIGCMCRRPSDRRGRFGGTEVHGSTTSAALTIGCCRTRQAVGCYPAVPGRPGYLSRLSAKVWQTGDGSLQPPPSLWLRWHGIRSVWKGKPRVKADEEDT